MDSQSVRDLDPDGPFQGPGPHEVLGATVPSRTVPPIPLRTREPLQTETGPPKDDE